MTTTGADAFAALHALWSLAGCDPAALEGVTLSGEDPSLPTTFKVGTAAEWMALTGSGASAS